MVTWLFFKSDYRCWWSLSVKRNIRQLDYNDSLFVKPKLSPLKRRISPACTILLCYWNQNFPLKYILFLFLFFFVFFFFIFFFFYGAAIFSECDTVLRKYIHHYFVFECGFTTAYAISAYHHWCCEFESRSGRVVQHYVIKFVSDFSMVLNATFNNISVISWLLVVLVEETRGLGENHRPVASHWQTLSRNVAPLFCIWVWIYNCLCN
jgi:hypothetical protein